MLQRVSYFEFYYSDAKHRSRYNTLVITKLEIRKYF